MNVGGATVEVNADLQKLLDGLNKAKAASGVFIEQAAKQFAALGVAATAAGVGVAGVAGKLTPTNAALKAMGDNTKAVTAGLTNMLGVLGKVAVAALSFTARHPVLGTALTTALLGGSPALAAATLAVGTERGRSMLGTAGRGLLAVGRNPLTALGGAGLGIAAIGIAAKAGAEGFEALKESFQEARKASVDLKTEIETLKNAAEKLSTEMPKGSALTDAALRRLGGSTGGLTSPFAQMVAGKVDPSTIEETDDALEELTLRFRDHERAAQLLGAALAEPAKGWRLLRDAGFAFTRDQARMFEGVRTMEERLKAASELLDIINGQIKEAKKSGFIEFMSQIGTFLGKAPQAVGEGFTSMLKGLGAGIAQLTGLDFVIKTVDEAFQSLGKAMEETNKRFFPANAKEELEAVNAKLRETYEALERLKQGDQGAGGESFLDRLFGRAPSLRDRARTQLENRAVEDEATRMRLVTKEAERLAEAELDRLIKTDDRLQDRINNLKLELELMQANSRAALEARRIASAEGVDKDDPRIKSIQNLLKAIEDRRRAQAQHGQLTVYERENQRLTQQVQLFRFGNQEMERRGQLLEIELRAAQRKQPLTDKQKADLLAQMKLLQEVQRLTGVVNEAFSSLFNSMGDALAEFAATGQFNMKQFADGIIRQLVRISTQAFVIQPLLNMISGFTNPLIGSMVSPGSTTSQIKIPTAGSHQHGGSFRVPGGGAGGDQPYLIGLAAGERVDVTPAHKAGSGGGEGVTVINNVNSSKDFEVTSQEHRDPSGRRIIEQTFNEVVRRIGRGDADNTFGARFGMRPRTLQR